MLLDAITKNFLEEQGRLQLRDANAYRGDAGHALNQLSVIWNGEDVVSTIAAQRYDAAAIGKLLVAAEALFPEVKQALQQATGVDRMPDCVALLGNGTANGHAVLQGENSYAWIALEAYTGEHQLRVFMTHEIVHALHYHAVPAWYPHTKAQYLETGRALFTEGLASWLTMKALGVSAEEALWGGYINDTAAAAWTQELATTEHDAWAKLKQHWTQPAATGLLFSANDAAPADNRAGYYYGLKLIERLAETRSVAQLLALVPEEVKIFVEQEM